MIDGAHFGGLPGPESDGNQGNYRDSGASSDQNQEGYPDRWYPIVYTNMTSISSAVVLLPEDGLPRNLQFHIFFKLKLPEIYLIQRSGIYSVAISNLLTTIRESMGQELTLVPKDIAGIISGSVTDEVPIDVATIRVPSFFDNMHRPSFGYRKLGPLNAIDIQFTPPCDDDNREVFAIQNNRNTTEYAECWKPYGLNVEKHFIVIFSLRSSSPSSPPNPQHVVTSSNTTRSLLSVHSSSFHTTSSPQPQALTTVAHRTPSPFNSHNGSSTHQSDPRESITMPGVDSNPHEGTGGVAADCGTTIEVLCSGSGITPSTVAAAKFNKGDSLLPMVLNHRAMSYILTALGFKDGDGPPSKGKVVSFGDSLELTTDNVLRAFNWTHESYKHKYKWYSWAEEVAMHYQWCAPTTTAGQNPAYDTWLGIKYFWGIHGPLQSGQWPDNLPSARCRGESAARSLSQTQIDKYKNNISASIVKATGTSAAATAHQNGLNQAETQASQA